MPKYKNYCQGLNTEAKCAPFTTSHGPGTPVCDQHIDRKCATFYDLYNGEPSKQRSCFNNEVGKEYICPTVSSGEIEYRPMSNWFAAQQSPTYRKPSTCFHQNPNIGVHELCPYKDDYSLKESPLWLDSSYNLALPKNGGKNQKGGNKSKNNNQTGRDACRCSQDYCKINYGPDYFNLAALGYQGQAYQPKGPMNGCPHNNN